MFLGSVDSLGDSHDEGIPGSVDFMNADALDRLFPRAEISHQQRWKRQPCPVEGDSSPRSTRPAFGKSQPLGRCVPPF